MSLSPPRPEVHDASSERPTRPAPSKVATTGTGIAQDRGEAPGLSPGSTSRYVIVGELGRGGMGRVFRAYDPNLQRQVALKVVEQRTDGGRVAKVTATQRLVAEARAMAQLSHRNVVAIYDVQVRWGGELVLVMEYVEGTTLTRWLALEVRPWREVVDAFVQAGHGIAAAHAAGILHRDFKPDNVLVTDEDVVKVTDFGVAKLHTEPGLDTDVLPASHPEVGGLTANGTVVGTPRYMAPEQHRGEALTEAADQYAFCVALWEALCGSAPFRGPRLAVEKRRGPPAWSNATVPRRIVAAIVRGLAPDPRDRWPSMSALIAALDRRPERRTRRGWALGFGTTAILGVAGAMAWSTLEARASRCTGAERHLVGIWDDAQREAVSHAILGTGRTYAPAVWERTGSALDAYAADWARMHTEACEATTVRGEQSTRILDARIACLHRSVTQLRATVETLTEADSGVLAHAHELIENLPALDHCADLEALEQDVEPPRADEAAAVGTIRRHLAIARARTTAARYPAAHEAVRAAKAAAAGVGYGPIHTEIALREGNVLELLGDVEEAERASLEALRSAARWRQWDALWEAALALSHIVGHEQLRLSEGLAYVRLARGLTRDDPRREASAFNNYATLLYHQGDFEAAEAQYRTALAVLTEALGAESSELSSTLNNLSLVLRDRGNYEEAETHLQAAIRLEAKEIGFDHPEVANTRTNLAVLLKRQGKFSEAEQVLRAVLADLERQLPPGHPDILSARMNFSNTLADQGKLAEAEVELRAGLEATLALRPDDHDDVMAWRHNLAATLSEQGKFPEAESEYRACIESMSKTYGPSHPQVAAARQNLAGTLESQGKRDAAEEEYRKAIAQFEEALGPRHPDLVATRSNFANLLAAQGKYEQAVAEMEEIIATFIEVVGPDHLYVGMVRTNLADLHLTLERSEEALQLAELAWTRLSRDDVSPAFRGKNALVLAEALWRTRSGPASRKRARTLMKDAVVSFGRAGDNWNRSGDEAARWLQTHRR